MNLQEMETESMVWGSRKICAEFVRKKPLMLAWKFY